MIAILKKIACGGLFVTTLFQVSAQVNWSFEDVLIKAEAQSIFKYQAIADNEIAQSRWDLFKTNLNPGVNLDILAPNFTKTSQAITQPDGSIFFQPVSQNNSSISLGIQQQIKATGGTIFVQSQLQRFDDFSLDFNQYNGIPVRLGIVQPILGFNELRWADQIEPLFLSEAQKKYIIDMENIHLRATSSYFDLLSAQLDEKIATSNTEVNEKLLEIANERFQLGKASRNDILQLELEYRAAVKDLSRAKYQVEFAQGGLNTFLGGQNKDAVNVQTPDPMDTDIDIDVALAIDKALSNRPEIIAFTRQKIEAERDIQRAKRDFGVQADLFAGIGFAKAAPELAGIYQDPLTEQQVQINVSIPILDWGRKKAAVGQAKAQKELIDQQIAQSLLDFKNEIAQMVNNWDQLQREVKVQKEIQDVSIERFEISRQRFILGDISITDLTIAQREKDFAQREYINTLRSYWSAYYQLRMLTGYDFMNKRDIIYTIN